jgi:hypothetical protein
MRLRLISACSVVVFGLATAVSVGASGCGSTDDDTDARSPGGGSSTSATFTDRTVPEDVTTASFAAEALSLGVTTAELKAASFGQIRIDDFNGKPLSYVTFLAPKAAAGSAQSAEEFLANLPLDEDAQAAQAEGAWLVVVSGATTTAAPRSLRTRSPALLYQFARAYQLAGGVGSVKRLVAAAPTVFFAETTAGTYISVYDGQIATDAEAQKLRDLADEGDKNAHTPEALAFYQAAWEQWMPLAAASAKERNQILDGVRGTDGQIDLAALADYLESSGAAEGIAALADDASFEDEPVDLPGPSTQGTDTTKTCWGKGPFKVCKGGVETAYYDNADYAKVTPHLEWPFEHTTNLSCTLPFVGGNPKGFKWEGCGPASFSTLMWRYWQKGTLFAANDCAPYNGEQWNEEILDGQRFYLGDDSKFYVDKNAAHKTKAESIRKVLGPLLSEKYMYACSVDATNAATAPNFWASGANKFFADEKLDLQAKSNWALSQVNALTRRDDFQKILNARVKKDAGPTIALISMDFLKFQGHYAPIFAYRIEKNPLGIITSVDVGVDTFSGSGKINRKSTKGYLTPDYHSIIDPRNPLPSGLFWVEGSGKGSSGNKCKAVDPEQNGCDHDVYTQGKPLNVACNACTKKVCVGDSYCCRLDSATAKWDLPCVETAKEICTPADTK